jgi:Putative metal-binding motif
VVPEVDASVEETEPLLTIDDPGPIAPAVDPTLGGRCLDDAQCDDGIACTFDECDLELERCKATPDDSLCQDDSYCNGLESCRPRVGCEPGQAVACDDRSPCTLDRCDEATRGCARTARDVDGDGDVDAHCPQSVDDIEGTPGVVYGADCDDRDPTVSSEHPEVCDNDRDDDCDGEVDEGQCAQLSGDNCRSELVVTEPSVLTLDLGALSADVASLCGAQGAADAIVWIEVPADKALYVRATSNVADVALAVQRTCGDVGTELVCNWGNRESQATGSRLSVAVAAATEVAGERVALRVSAEGLGPAQVELEVEFEPVPEPLVNDDCSGALRIQPDEPLLVDLRTARAEGSSHCATPRAAGGGVLEPLGSPWADASYELVLEEAQDVTVYAVTEDDAAQPALALFSGGCGAESEVVCTRGNDSELFVRSLPAGTYQLLVAATVPAPVHVVLALTEPSTAPAGEQCEPPLDLPLGEATVLDPIQFADDLRLGCSNFGRDLALEFELEERSDVLLRARASAAERVAVALATDEGECLSEQLACGASLRGQPRVAVHNLAAGSYRAALESEIGNPLEALLLRRPARAPVVVAVADNCDDPLPVPAVGGFFTGDTARAGSDFTASCDLAGVAVGGSSDQLLALSFEDPTRLVLLSRGSEIPLLVNLRSGQTCPGTEVERGCFVADGPEQGGYFERVLPAGDYWLQVMGYAGGAGRWELEIFTDASR